MLILTGLGAVGVWYALVEDIKLAFLGGLIALAASVIAAFRGNFNLPEDIPTDARMDMATAGYTGAMITLAVVGAASMWFGIVEDIKIGFAVGLLALAATVILLFSGGPKSAGEREYRDSDATMKTVGLSALVLTALGVGAAGVWYALIEDVKIGFAIGLLALAGATLTAFRGKLAG
jgi:hypothetical protein